MFQRWTQFGTIFVSVGLVLGAFVIFSDDWECWQDVLVAYTLCAGLIGSWCILFGGRSAPVANTRWPWLLVGAMGAPVFIVALMYLTSQAGHWIDGEVSGISLIGIGIGASYALAYLVFVVRLSVRDSE